MIEKRFINKKIPNPIQFSNEEYERIDKEIHQMLKAGIITPADNHPEEGEFISNIFIRPKKGWQCKSYFKFETFQ